MFVLIAGLIAGIVVALFFIVMTFLIIYFMNKKKESLTIASSANMPLRIRDSTCTPNDVGTLRCMIA